MEVNSCRSTSLSFLPYRSCSISNFVLKSETHGCFPFFFPSLFARLLFCSFLAPLRVWKIAEENELFQYISIYTHAWYKRRVQYFTLYSFLFSATWVSELHKTHKVKIKYRKRLILFSSPATRTRWQKLSSF